MKTFYCVLFVLYLNILLRPILANEIFHQQDYNENVESKNRMTRSAFGGYYVVGRTFPISKYKMLQCTNRNVSYDFVF